MGSGDASTLPVWRECPEFFRGAAGFIHRPRWWGTSQLVARHG